MGMIAPNSNWFSFYPKTGEAKELCIGETYTHNTELEEARIKIEGERSPSVEGSTHHEMRTEICKVCTIREKRGRIRRKGKLDPD